MKKLFCIILLAVLTLNLSACGTKTEENTDKYIIQTTYYQIYEQDSHTYKYTIKSGDDILAEDTKTGTAPRIDDIDDGIVRFHLGFGTNAFTVKYFNVYDETISEEFYPYSIYADHVDTAKKQYYIAYFTLGEEPALHIKGFFDSSEFSNELYLDLDMPTCEKLIFLNETQIYIEYTNSFGDNIKTIIDFKNSSGRKIKYAW